MDAITKVNPRISKLILNPEKTEKPGSNGPAFSDRLKAMLDDTNRKQHVADNAVHKVTNGEMDIQEGMIALSEADISLRYLVQVRSKVLQAYNDIIKMQI